MTINWFTVAAQVVNFLVLVFLLQRFLYGPIVRTMERRQETIRTQLEEAESARSDAQAEAKEYRRKQDELEQRRENMLAEMQDEVEEQRAKRVQEIRTESDRLRRQWHEALEADQEEFARDLRAQLSQEFFALARRALAELADAELEIQATRAFLQHIRNQDEEAWRAFIQSVNEKGEPVVVRSAFDLSSSLRKEIEQALQEQADTEVGVRFEQEPSLIAGIELQAQSHVAAWQLDDYLSELQARSQSLIESKLDDGNKPDEQTAEDPEIA